MNQTPLVADHISMPPCTSSSEHHCQVSHWLGPAKINLSYSFANILK